MSHIRQATLGFLQGHRRGVSIKLANWHEPKLAMWLAGHLDGRPPFDGRNNNFWHPLNVGERFSQLDISADLLRDMYYINLF